MLTSTRPIGIASDIPHADCDALRGGGAMVDGASPRKGTKASPMLQLATSRRMSSSVGIGVRGEIKGFSKSKQLQSLSEVFG